ncbi:MAG: hypothetical protein FWD04_13065 [Conexibacteraceae bacterium]|nr:hypothetical protein [Conexibacteraceae bacterium]
MGTGEVPSGDGRPVVIDPGDVEAIAQRVVELAGQRSRLVDAQTVAAALDVHRVWVYAHARELGVMRLGTGPKARLRFDLGVVRERLAVLAEDDPPAAPEPRHCRYVATPGVKLIQGRSTR